MMDQSEEMQKAVEALGRQFPGIAFAVVSVTMETPPEETIFHFADVCLDRPQLARLLREVSDGILENKDRESVKGILQ